MLTDREMSNITGGASKIAIAALIGAAVTFIFSVIDGYLRPLKCN